MKTHQEIDRRSLALAKALVSKLENGDLSAGIRRARDVNKRWREIADSMIHAQWSEILAGDWLAIRSVLLDASERGCQLRQNNPFCGILSPRERWAIYREFRDAA